MSSHQILLVDDEIEIHDSFKQIFFDRKNLNLYFAKNSNEGMKVLENDVIDIVISDLIMPDTFGIDFLKEVKRHYPETIRMLLTGYSDINATIEAINKDEIYRYLTKPWNSDELIIIIDQALEFLDLKKKTKELSKKLQKKNRELKESRDLFISILNSIGDGVITTDFEGVVTFINPVSEAYTGFTSKDAIGKMLSEIFYIIHGNKRIPLENPIAKMLKEGITIKHYKNYLLVNKKGVEIEVDFSISPIINKENNMTGKGIVLVFHETCMNNPEH